MQEFLLNLFKTVGIQLFSLFGIFFILGFILAKLQKWTNNAYTRSIGWKGILLTAWFGTPIHEIGHILFAKLFRHKITHVDLFEPNESTGGLGHVEHEYQSHSLYQRVGNFFIGAAPMIFGSLVLLVLLYFFVPNAKEVFQHLNQEEYNIVSLLVGFPKALMALFSLQNIQTGIFYAFLYLSFCVASHIAPSGQDLKNMWSGLVWMVVLLILINAIPVFLEINITEFIKNIYIILAIFIGIFLYAIFISVLHFVFISLISLLFRK
jgi:hypothetical protein